MTSNHDDTKRSPARTFGPSRRAILAGGTAGAATVAAGRASAQSPFGWLENLGNQGFGGNAKPPRSEQAKVESLNDLRADRVPWRSDEMMGNVERAIERYEKIVANGGWPAVQVGRLLRVDDDDDRLIPIKRRLGMSGDLRAPQSYFNNSRFDERLEEAVRSFQEQFGLRVTGRIDRPTAAQLAVPARARLEQLRLNQRRLRDLMTGRIEDRYVLVNSPAFQLEAVENHQVQLRHRVIAGKPDRQTPSVKASIRALNFFPFWNVPDSVAVLDLVPRVRKEPDYLEKEHIRAYTPRGELIDMKSINWDNLDPKHVRFRQDPGPHNALGLVRIDMPNSDIVYMHDTPMKQLFNQRVRPFSAGCVRVQDVFTLVEWIAKYEAGWDQPGRAQAVVDNGQALDVMLTRQVPVYFTYLTAWAEGDGKAVFRPDVYGRDGLKELVGERDPDAPAPPVTLAP
jgi:murein L,D-transpeptidase YcbB/YkuD